MDRKWMCRVERGYNIPLMISAYPNIGLKDERGIVYKFHKWKSNNWKCNCVWICRCLLRCSDASRLRDLLLNFPEWWIFSFMWPYGHTNAGCVHRVLSAFSFDFGSERWMKEIAIWRHNRSLIIVSFIHPSIDLKSDRICVRKGKDILFILLQCVYVHIWVHLLAFLRVLIGYNIRTQEV
jgi:hypothetical protein